MYPHTLPVARPTNDDVGVLHIFHPKGDASFLRVACRRLPGTNSRDLVVSQSLIRELCTVIIGDDIVAHPDRAFLSTNPLPNSNEGKIPANQATLLPGDLYLHVTSNPDYKVLLDAKGWVPLQRSQLGARWFTEFHPKDRTTPAPPIVSFDWDARSQGLISTAAKNMVAMTCVVTGWQGSTETLDGAHVVPHAYLQWYREHQLGRQLYRTESIPRSSPNVLADIRNLLPISVTVHRCWDDWQLVFIPVEGIPGIWIMSFIGFKKDALAVHHHWRQVAIPPHIDPYLLYLRFALTTFQHTVGNFHELTGNVYNRADTAATDRPDVPHLSPFNSHTGSTQGDKRRSSDAMENDSDDWPTERDTIRKAFEGEEIPDSIAGLFEDPAEDEKMNRIKQEYIGTHPNVSGLRTTI